MLLQNKEGKKKNNKILHTYTIPKNINKTNQSIQNKFRIQPVSSFSAKTWSNVTDTGPVAPTRCARLTN